MTGTPIRCPGCGNVLGLLYPGYALVRHRGRVWAGAVLAIVCEDCGGVWGVPDLLPGRECQQTRQEGEQTAFLPQGVPKHLEAAEGRRGRSERA